MLTACLPLLKFSARTLNPSMWLMKAMEKTAGNTNSALKLLLYLTFFFKRLLQQRNNICVFVVGYLATKPNPS